MKIILVQFIKIFIKNAIILTSLLLLDEWYFQNKMIKKIIYHLAIVMKKNQDRYVFKEKFVRINKIQGW